MDSVISIHMGEANILIRDHNAEDKGKIIVEYSSNEDHKYRNGGIPRRCVCEDKQDVLDERHRKSSIKAVTLQFDNTRVGVIEVNYAKGEGNLRDDISRESPRVGIGEQPLCG